MGRCYPARQKKDISLTCWSLLFLLFYSSLLESMFMSYFYDVLVVLRSESMFNHCCQIPLEKPKNSLETLSLKFLELLSAMKKSLYACLCMLYHPCQLQKGVFWVDYCVVFFGQLSWHNSWSIFNLFLCFLTCLLISWFAIDLLFSKVDCCGGHVFS